MRVAALLALLSSLSWGVADFLGGLAARRAGTAQVLAVSYPAGAISITVLAIFVVPGTFTTELIGISILAGSAGVTAVSLLYAAMVRGQMGVVAPITAVMSCAVPVLVGLFRGDQPSAYAFFGMGFAIIAVVLVSRESAHHHGKTPILAIGFSIASGCAGGVYLTVIGLAPVESGVWVAALGRWFSTIIMITFVLVVVRSFNKSTFPWKLAIITGVLDSTANCLFQLASQRGLFSVVAILGSLYPVATVLLARVVIKERMNRVQSVGVVLALGAAVLLAFNS